MQWIGILHPYVIVLYFYSVVKAATHAKKAETYNKAISKINKSFLEELNADWDDGVNMKGIDTVLNISLLCLLTSRMLGCKL